MDPLARLTHLRREIRHHEERYYIHNAPDISDEEFDRLLHELERLEAEYPDLVTPEQWDELLHSLQAHASIDYAYRRATEFAERAKKPLYAFPPSSDRDALLALPDYVLSRDR